MIVTRSVGNHHRKQRKVLNPVFSEKHMRGVLPIFVPIVQKACFCLRTHSTPRLISSKLCRIIDKKTEKGNANVNIFEWSSRTSLELIAQGGMGTSLDNLTEGETSKLTELAKEMV